MDLYPFQQHGAEWLASRTRAYLGDVMGLGKTRQACAAARIVQPRRTLVICPASVVPHWREEWEEHGPDRPVDVRSYAASGGPSHALYDLVILDEAHYCKSQRAQRTKRALGYAQAAPRAWLLSGTPTPNHPGELYAPIKYLWPEILHDLGVRSYMEWLSRFTHWRMTRYGARPYAAKNTDALRAVVRRIMLRRKLDDVEIELPPLRVDTQYLPRGGVADRINAALSDAGFEDEEDVPSPVVRRVLGEIKAPLVADALREELAAGAYDKIVVFAYHHDTMDLLESRLGAFGVSRVDGRTNARKRKIMLDCFNVVPSTRVLIVQQQAGGTGLNLQVAAEVALVEPAWSPDDNAQAIKRIHRIGQTRPCRARLFAVPGTLDRAIMRALAQKIEMCRAAGL